LEQTQAVYVAAPGGKARIFDGRTDFLQVRDHPDLRMTGSLTLDAWVWLEELHRGPPQCILDKGGERYRLQIEGDRVLFGLKGENARLDLGGGRLTAHAWHRITGVFQRPNAALYIDGQLAAQKVWDHDIAPGGELYIGAQSGSICFLHGRLDELRIYHQARTPLAIDAPSSEAMRPHAPPEGTKLEVAKIPGGVTVDTGAARFELRDDGVLAGLRVGERTLVTANHAPLLTAESFSSQDYDGWRDLAIGKTVAATWRSAGHDYARGKKEFRATYTGRLDFGSGDSIDVSLILSTSAGSPLLTATAQLAAQGSFENRFVRSVALRLPLDLAQRKRIVQAGDRGVQWNTRYWYQFLVSTVGTLLPEPDHNLWRIFAIDQNTPGDYHLWRSESLATCPLSMQRGLQAPGWMAVYDQQVGLLLAYRGFSSRAPKSLRVLAEGCGEAAICLWHPGLPALDVHSPTASAVFGQPHVTDWMAFTGDFADRRPDLSLAERWGVETLRSDPPPRNEIPLADLNLLDAPAADAEAPPVTGGVALPRGALMDPGQVRLRHAGADVPLQARAIGYWPDRSVKWLLLTFPSDGGAVQGASGEGEGLSFDVTRRDGSKSVYRLDYGGRARPGTPRTILTAKQRATGVQIDTGPLQLELSTGERWLRSARLQGREMLSQGGARSFVDCLRTEPTYSCMTTHAQGVEDDGRFVAQSLQLEEAGPLRAVVRLEGMTTAKEPNRVIVRVEAYAGRSVARVFQSVEFLHKDPRVTFVRRMGIELPLASVEAAHVTAGGEKGPLALAQGVRAGLKQHSHLGYQAWHQLAAERFLRFDEVAHRSRGWLDLAGPHGGVALVLRDMWQQFPNELMADLSGQRLVGYFWPESEPVMDVRRYSNYPHSSQGESTASDSNWVARNYYGKDPFVGVSKTHEMLLYFHAPEVDGRKVDAVAADFQRPPLVYAGGDWSVKAGVVLPQSLPSSDNFPRAHANLDHFARFWIHHQKLWGWYGLWDYGDVHHEYKRGYGWILPADKLAELLHRGPTDYEKLDVSKFCMQDYTPDHEWAFDNGRWGWNNTEGLPGLYLQNHYLRTGDREVFFFAEAMARHFRDVDMRHDGRWFGEGTRHGVQHWSDGDHEERQTTHSEFRYIYGLTGDPRSRDFARQLFERVYSQRDVRIHAAHSGRLQGLLTWWEMTGSQSVEAILAKYIPCFLVPGGICESPDVRFPAVKCISQSRDINAGNMFFWTFGAGHGMLEYYYLTGDEEVRRALLQVADHAMKRPDPGNFRKAVIFAARHADAPGSYRDYLQNWARGSDDLTQIVPHNPQFYAGPRGMLRGTVSGALFVMNDLCYLLSVLNGDPKLSARQWETIRQVDRNGGPFTAPPELSWQSDYDRPELQEYLRIKHPQP
jgi:hypothetical protein